MSLQPLPTDDLFQVERKIARRADTLSRRLGVDRGRDLDHWRQAEREVWGEPATVEAALAAESV